MCCSEAPRVTWQKVDDSLPAYGRVSFEEVDTRMVIAELEMSDEGMYRCVGDNDVDITSTDIALKVEGE